MKKNRIVISFISVFIIFLLLAFISITVNVKAMTVNLFESRNMKIITSETAPQDKFPDLRKGLILQGKEGSYAQFKNNFAGVFDIELLVYSQDCTAASTKIQFQDDLTDESFFVEILADGYDYNVSIYLNGESAGLSYTDRGLLLGVTAGCNADGRFTEVEDGGALRLTFNPTNMSLYISNENIEDRLVWDFTKESNDGQNIGATLQNFNSYSVKFLPNGNEIVNTFIYSINDQSLNEDMILKDAPARVWADISTYGVVNQPYKIPHPVISDLVKGVKNGTNVEVSIETEKHIAVKKGVWTEDFTFTPELSGEYLLTYTWQDNVRGSIIESDFTTSIVVLDETPAIEFKLSNDIPKSVTTGSILELPSAYFIDNSYIRSVISNSKISVYCDNVLQTETLENNNFKFDKSGVYTIKYIPENSDIKCEHAFTVNSNDNGYCFNIIDGKDSYLVGEEFVVPDAYMVLGGEEVKASHIVMFPNGATYSNAKFKISQAGTYKIVYTATVNGMKFSETKTVTAYVKGSEMFINNSPDGLPVTITEGKHNMTDNLNGVIVTSEERGSIRYKNIIDLSKKCKDDMLIDLIVMPTVQGQEDFKRIVITLTDIYDPNNFVRIELNDPAGRDECAGTSTYVSAGANGQTHIGVTGGNVWEHVYEELYYTPYYPVSYGYDALHSFSSRVYHVPLDMQTFKVYFDYDERAVYGSESWYNTWNNPTTKSYLITDLDDPKLYTSLWEGFTTGEVYMDISTSGLEASRNKGVTEKARYMILGVDGVSFNEYAFKDTEAPEINVNLPKDIPVGEQKKAYKVFEASAYDISGGIIRPEVKVFYDYGKETCVQIGVKDGFFEPIYSGVYSIVYTASDIYGNTAIKVANVNIKRELSALTLNALDHKTTTYVGAPVSLAEINVSGGTQSNYTIDKTVTLNGEVIEINENSLLPLREGTYEVIISVKDYIGNTAKYSYNITAQISDLPILNEEIILSKYYINGLTYYLPMYEAIDYSNPSTPVSIKPIVTTIDASGKAILNDDLKYIPKVTNKNDTVQIIYTFSSAQGKKLEIKKDIPAINPLLDNGDIDKTAYFIVDGQVETIAHSDKIEYVFSSNISLEFTKALLANNFSAIFNVDKSNVNMNSIVLTLTDSKDITKSVKIEVIREAGKSSSQLKVNGGQSQKINWAFDTGNTNFEIYYDNETYMLKGAGNSIIGKINTYEDGSQFKGFESQYVHLSIDVIGVTAQTSFSMISINNQTMNNIKIDTVAPSIIFEKDVVLRGKVGESVYLPYAYAGDVLGDSSSVKVTVKDMQTNEFVTSVEGKVLNDASAESSNAFIPAKSGTYFVQYYSMDNSGNETYELRYIFISAVDVPTLEIEGIPSSVRLGKTVKLPRPEAGETNYYIILVNPVGFEQVIKESEFKADMKGSYKVKYVIFDKDYSNSVTQEFIIEVK